MAGAIALSACGSNGGRTTVGGAASTRKPLPLTARVIRGREFRTYSYIPGQGQSFPTAKAWVAADTSMTPEQRTAEVARLTSEGFKTDLTEFLTGPQGPQTGLSAVMQLGSAASARAELVAELAARQPVDETFSVKGIPGAVGFGYSGGGQGGENVLFTDGPFLYFLGYGWFGTQHNPKHSLLIEAASKLYERVHGHPAG